MSPNSTVLSSVAGKDATKRFDKYHRRGILEPYKPTLQIGVLGASGEGTKGGSAKQKLLRKFGFGVKK
jgi:hypothetical protein